jgi:hypothetical protein
MMPHQSRVSRMRHLKVLFARLLRCVKWSFLGTNFASILPCRKSVQESQFDEMVLFRNTSLMNHKKSGSFWCVCRKLRVGRSSHDDVTYFSHGCCNAGSLIETALLGLGVSWWSF